jgi:hypothetical protein
MPRSLKTKLVDDLNEMNGSEMLSWGFLILACLSFIGWLLFGAITHLAETAYIVSFLIALTLSSIGVGAILKAAARRWLNQTNV